MALMRLGTRRSLSSVAGRLGIAAIALGAAAACGDDEVTPPPPPPPPGVSTVTITPGDVAVLTGGTVQLSAEVIDDDGDPVSGATITWSSSDDAVASVNNSGLVTAGNAGSATITATSDGVSGTATAAVVAAAAFDADVQPIFTNNCAFAGCHGGGAPQQGMDLEDGAAYMSIVNVASMELPSMDRIEPNEPFQSYMVHKLRGTQADVGGSGDRMPLGGMLDAGDINIIRAWVRSGAPEN